MRAAPRRCRSRPTHRPIAKLSGADRSTAAEPKTLIFQGLRGWPPVNLTAGQGVAAFYSNPEPA